MNPEGTGPTKIEQLNQLIRSYCVVILVTTFCVVFIMGAVATLRDRSQNMLIATESFLLILNTALIWWFKSRDDKVITPAVTTTTTPDGTITSTAPGAIITRPEKGTP
jgi:hypothetical protein